MSDIVQKVKEFIDNNNIEGKILLALSGGCDSVVLLHVLYTLGVDVVAIHLNHNWRGDESKRDEEFSRKYCESLGVDFYSQTLLPDVKKTENDAREARYDFFEKCAKKFGASCVFLAHNMDDNAQTVLYRIIKGTGLKGLCAIPKIRGIYCRPLLDILRCDIEKYAKDNNLKYVFDSSNADVKYKRNLIRKEILPVLKKINPDVVFALNNLSKLSIMHYDTVFNDLQKVKEEVLHDDKIVLSKFLKLKKAQKFELINDYIGEKLKYRDFSRIKSYVDFIESKYDKCAKKSLNRTLFLEISEGYAFVSDGKKEQNLQEIEVKSQGEYVFGSKKVVIKKAQGIVDLKNSAVNFLNLDFSSNLVIRTRREGDVFSPFGTKAKNRKLKEYLIDKKIPRQKRENLLLLASGSEILCILGMQVSQKAAVDDKTNCYEIRISE